MSSQLSAALEASLSAENASIYYGTLEIKEIIWGLVDLSEKL